MNFRFASRIIEADLTSDLSMDTSWPTDRPTIHQPDPRSDGLDPGAIGGPSMYNSFGPLGEKVVSDPLVPTSNVVPGQPIPHIKGPDVDTCVLKDFRGKI